MNKINFDPTKWKKTGWIPALIYLEIDNYEPRLVVRVATGRKYWPIFSEVIDIDKGLNDPALEIISISLLKYTHPMIDRFKSELETMLSDIYGIEITLQ